MFSSFFMSFISTTLSSKLHSQATFYIVSVSIILHDNARARTADAVEDLLRRWRWKIQEQPPGSPDMSPRDYDVFAKMREPRRWTHYNTREEIIPAVGRSLLDINRIGHADDISRLPQI
jgi:transposase